MSRTRPGRWARWSVLAVAMFATVGVARAQAVEKKDGYTLHDDMRKLWVDHVSWTRMYIISAIAKLPDQDAILERLLKNQDDIGDAVKPFYGDPAGQKLSDLLKEHIRIAGDVVGAATKGDNPGVEAASRRWTANADEIAVFLSAANPVNWPVDDLKKMLRHHLDLTTQEVTTHLAKDWKGSIAAYDKVQVQALVMADALSAGILKQFPQKVL